MHCVYVPERGGLRDSEALLPRREDAFLGGERLRLLE
jgi:hypothetical protein